MNQQNTISFNKSTVNKKINNLSSNNRNEKLTKLGNNKHKISVIETPQRFLGSKITTKDNKIINLPYKELDPKTNTYKLISSPELKQAIDWKSAELGIESKELDALGERMCVNLFVGHNVEGIEVETKISDSEAKKLKIEYKPQLDKMINEIDKSDVGFYDQHIQNINDGKLEPDKFILDTEATKAILSTDDSSNLNNVSNDIVSKLVPTTSNKSENENITFFSKIVDYTTKIKQDFFDLAFKKISPESLISNIEENIKQYATSLRSKYVNSISVDENLRKIFKDTGFVKDYMEYQRKTAEYKELVGESTKKIKSNYNNLFNTFKAVFFNESLNNQQTGIEKIPLDNKEQIKEYFTLRMEGKALINKLKACFDAHENMIENQINNLVNQDAKKLTESLINKNML